jgi:hypothetical protein
VWTASRPGRLYPRERPGTHCTGGWVGPGAGLDRCRKSRSTGIRSPDLPARSESLYRLRYPGSRVYKVIYKNIVQPDRPQLTVPRLRIACWIPKATNTHRKYVKVIALPKWLRQRASMLRSMYTVFFGNNYIFKIQ